MSLCRLLHRNKKEQKMKTTEITVLLSAPDKKELEDK